MPGVAATPHMTLLTLSVVLLILHITLQGGFATRELGRDWNAGARDDDRKPEGRLAGRAARALNNYRETYPAFVGLILALALVAPTGAQGTGLAGAWLWFGARILYVPLYLGGVPYVRSLVWLVSLLGLALMAAALFG